LEPSVNARCNGGGAIAGGNDVVVDVVDMDNELAALAPMVRGRGFGDNRDNSANRSIRRCNKR
jgi:hypothetical protein